MGWLIRAGVLLTLLLAGAQLALAVQAEAAGDDQAMLRERAEARWQALIDEDFKFAYEFETPAYRDVYSASDFKRGFGRKIIWTKARVADVQIEDDDVAQVKMVVQYQFIDPLGQRAVGSRPLEESWIKADGQWWHLSK